MNTFKVSVQETNNNAIVKFELNQFITQHQSFEFNNIDEAKTSPLAQQLFYLPFVKKVYISGNFIAIERYDIVDWNDVKNEVAEQIVERLLDAGADVGICLRHLQDRVRREATTTDPGVVRGHKLDHQQVQTLAGVRAPFEAGLDARHQHRLVMIQSLEIQVLLAAEIGIDARFLDA